MKGGERERKSWREKSTREGERGRILSVFMGERDRERGDEGRRKVEKELERKKY